MTDDATMTKGVQEADMAIYYAVVDANAPHIKMNSVTHQLEIYEERADAERNRPVNTMVVEVTIKLKKAR